MANPRQSNRHERKLLSDRVRAQQGPCGICLGRIDYSLTTWTDPKDRKTKPHPMRYELDEINPLALWEQYGYQSKTAAALDPSNVQPSHRYCNQWKGKHTMKWVQAHRHELREELTRRGYARWPKAGAEAEPAARKKPVTSRSW